jgi:uncharacterized alpha-E superfamily protein
MTTPQVTTEATAYRVVCGETVVRVEAADADASEVLVYFPHDEAFENGLGPVRRYDSPSAALEAASRVAYAVEDARQIRARLNQEIWQAYSEDSGRPRLAEPGPT